MLRDLELLGSESPPMDPSVLRDQRLSNRIFNALFIFSFLIILVVLSTRQNTSTFTIRNPTYIEYLDLYGNQQRTITCSCSQVLIKYDEFIHIDFTQHQVCTSVFVTDEWINYIRVTSSETAIDDFLTTGMKLFDGLRSFCQMTNRTIRNTLVRLYADQYFTTSLIAPNDFQTQIETLFQQFLSSTTNNLQLSLKLFSSLAHVNAFWSGISSNYGFLFLPDDYFASIQFTTRNSCSCNLSPSCTAEFFIYGPNNTIRYAVPGLYTGCLFTEALLKSDLHCLYNQNCISEIQSHINGSDNKIFLPLDSSRPSRFTPKSSVHELMEKLLVEIWNLSYRHQDYYKKCSPRACTYTDVHHYDALFIVTALLSLMGGVVLLLRLVIPCTVKCGRQIQIWIVDRREENRPAAHFSLYQMFMTIFRYLQSLNIFDSVPPSANNGHELRQQKILTKLYIILLCSSVIILFVYISVIHVPKTERISTPTLEQYVSLYEKYSQTVSCPCSQISIYYESFVDIQYTLHDICQSVFVTQCWFDYLAEATVDVYTSTLDFRWISPWKFQALQMFCHIANRTVVNSRHSFYLDRFVTAHLTTQDSFQVQINAISDQFIRETSEQFSSSFDIVGDMNQANAIMTAIGNQYLIQRIFLNASAMISFIIYGECSCAESGNCNYEAFILDESADIHHSITGIYTGCIVAQALLESSLLCLYDQTYINTFVSYLAFSPSINITRLNASALEKHRINSTVQELVDHLMIERWNIKIEYEKYYNSCRPIYCSYSYDTENDIIFLLITLFGLISGLSIILPIIISYSIKFLQNFLKLFTNDDPNTSPDNNRVEQLQIRWWLQVINLPLELNYFTSKPPTTDPEELVRQKIATRVFIVLFLISTTILIVCNSSITTEKSIIVKKPSLEQYFYYSQIHSQTFSCRCSKTVIDYDRFLQIKYIKHPLCQSTFVTGEFRVTFLLSMYDTTASQPSPEPHGTLMVFQALEELCRLVNQTIRENIDEFFSKKYITTTAPTLKLFHSQTQIMFDTFLSSMIDSVVNTVENLHDFTQMNGFFSGKTTNYHMSLVPVSGSQNTYLVIPKSQKYADCDCAMTSRCVKPVTISYGSNMENEFWLRGLYTGCYITVALLQSTLECLFSSKCLAEMRSHLLFSSALQMYPLDPWILRKSNTNSTLQELLNRMFVEEWNFTRSFANYYKECAPDECIYIEVTRQERIYVVTATFGLIGGLVPVLKFSLQIITTFLSSWIRRNRQRVVPQTVLT